jgi:hypothetical protein
MAYGFTYTLPTIAGSHTDFAVLFKTADFPTAAINGTTNALNNGGGNLVAYTSDAKSTQLPLEIVRFVSGGSPDAEVWVKIPTLATNATIYIEADSSQTSQPATTYIYGRDAVWSDYAAVLHLSESSGNGTAGEFVDSTGNGHGGELTTGTSISGVGTAHPWGGSWLNFNGTEAITLASSDSMLDGSDLILSAWANFDERSPGEGLFGNRSSSPDNNWIQLQSSARLFVKAATTEDTIDPTEFSGSTSLLAHAEFEKANRLEVFEDGVTLGSAATSIHSSNQSGITGAADYRIGTYFEDRSSRKIDGRVGEVRARASLLANNWKVTEYDNQSSSSAWGTAGTWADAGGSSDATGNVTLPSLTLSGAALVAYLASGASTLPSLTISGAAAAVNPAPTSGQIDLPSLTISGTAVVANPATTSGQIDLPSLTVSGFALLTQDASGVFSLPSLSVTGSSDTAYLSAGGVSLPSLTTNGVAAAAVLGQATGNIILPQLTLSGVGLIALNASGAFTLPQILLAGEASGPVLGGGAIRVINSTDLAEYVNASVSYQEGIIAVDDVGTDLHPSNGIYYVSNQRIAVSFEASVFRIAGGIPFTSTGRIAMSTSAVSYYANNLPFTANGQIAVNQVSNVIRCSDIVSCTDIIPCGG